MNNVKTLRDDLVKAYKQLRKGKISIPEAKALANMAGKVIIAAKVQMDYNKMTGAKNKSIKFLESDS